MNSKPEIYEVEFTEDCRAEIREIYKYISEKLVAKEAAKKLMRKIRNTILNLEKSPKLYMKIKNKYNREYRRIVTYNYIILYTIDEKNKKIYIVHMYYARKNYL
jgi:toxin ParE1/3/4